MFGSDPISTIVIRSFTAIERCRRLVCLPRPALAGDPFLDLHPWTGHVHCPDLITQQAASFVPPMFDDNQDAPRLRPLAVIQSMHVHAGSIGRRRMAEPVTPPANASDLPFGGLRRWLGGIADRLPRMDESATTDARHP